MWCLFYPSIFFKLTLSPISLHPNRSHLCNGYLCFECSSTIFNYFLNLHSLPSFLCNTNFSSPTSFLFSSQSSRSLISILILLRFNLFLNSFPQVRFLSSALLSLSLSLSVLVFMNLTLLIQSLFIWASFLLLLILFYSPLIKYPSSFLHSFAAVSFSFELFMLSAPSRGQNIQLKHLIKTEGSRH